MKFIHQLFSIVLITSIFSAGIHTCSAKDNVKNKGGTALHFVKSDLDLNLVFIVEEPILIPFNSGVIAIHDNAKSVRLFDLVTNPFVCKNLQYSMAYLRA